MARAAGPARQLIVVIRVAMRALQVRMPAGQRKPNRVVVKICRLPGAGGVAGLAGLREIKCHVVGISGFLEIREMASHACRRCVFKSVPDVARGALKRGMHPGQGKASELQMVKTHSKPIVEAMTLLTCRRKSR
jgi:hypothetical protein